MNKASAGDTGIIPLMTIIFIILSVSSAATATTYVLTDSFKSQGTISVLGNSDSIDDPNNYGNVDVNKPVNGGSSGGGGGGNSGEAFENILVSETEREYVNTGSKVSYTFDLTGNIIRHINFTGVKSSGQISVKIEILRGISSMVEQMPPEIVYKHLNIWAGNLGWATPGNIKDPVIEFKVEKSWISQNKIDTSTIRLYRYTNGVWSSLETDQVDEDSEFYYFNAKTLGFTNFVVSGNVKNSEPKANIGGERATEPGAEINDLVVKNTTEKAQESPAFSLIAGLVALVIVCIRRK
ncbi:MAG: PGF-pre-PGF domain-containing protein [Methanosarcinales archaeon]|nr:PGF-pre-PGF domain-containing protein [ANME-2 cluster archaeon]MDF1530953.1 PGF-pre-PGF domain-containing protein [ANME-2 cluster archaeon]MDW7775102.1 PGF-pre-PGF domain-containing protein [Methanosarcinales archaeon]